MFNEVLKDRNRRSNERAAARSGKSANKRIEAWVVPAGGSSSNSPGTSADSRADPRVFGLVWQRAHLADL